MTNRFPGLARIVIVEDERLVARDLADTLTDCGYEVVGNVGRGDDAVLMAQQQAPDLVLMDIRIDGPIDGVEAAKQIRQSRDVPIIFLTAHSDTETLRRATATDPMGYLVKPFKAAELKCAIELALHRQQITASLKARDHALTEQVRTIQQVLGIDDTAQGSTLTEAFERRVAERTEKLEATNRELEAFSYSVAHDLRAPLRGIDGFSQALVEEHAENLGSEGFHYLQRVRGATSRMMTLIDDLLELGRVSNTPLRRDPVDLSAMAATLVDHMQASHPSRRVVFNATPGIRVEGDPSLLRIVMENLLRNAWKFTGPVAHPRLEVGLIQQEGKPACFVRDNGVGFDMRYAGKLFTPFQRLHSGEEFPGTGIGLAIVHRIITRHRGRVWAESAPGVGTTVAFQL